MSSGLKAVSRALVSACEVELEPDEPAFACAVAVGERAQELEAPARGFRRLRAAARFESDPAAVVADLDPQTVFAQFRLELDPAVVIGGAVADDVGDELADEQAGVEGER